METYLSPNFKCREFPSDLGGNRREVEIDLQRQHSGDKEVTELREALVDARWTFRTIDGLARQTRLPGSRVEEILEDNPALARRSVMKMNDGSDLYVACERPPTVRERLEQLRWLLAR